MLCFLVCLRLCSPVFSLFRKENIFLKEPSVIKEISEICGGHFVTKIEKKLGFHNNMELAKCPKPIESEWWDDKMFGKELYGRANKWSPITPLEGPPQASDVSRREPSGLNSGHYKAPRDAYLFIVAMPNYRGNSIVPSLGYEVGGSSRRVQDNEDGDGDMSDQFVHCENYFASDDDIDGDDD
nr:hypothetical protein [Tanacetum cinerariifolium]